MRDIRWCPPHDGLDAEDPECVLLDVGGDLENAERWLASPERKGRPVVVCCSAPGIEALRRLIAAGAAEVQSYPLTMETLVKRIVRTARSRRTS